MPSPSSARIAQEKIKHITSAAECPALIGIICPDEVRRTRIRDLILSAFVPAYSSSHAALPNMALTCINGEELSQSELRHLSEEASSLSLFASVRYFVISKVELLSADTAKVLGTLIDNAAPHTKFIVTGREISRASPLAKLLERRETFISLDELKGIELSRWVDRELRRCSLVCAEPEVLATLVEIGEHSPDEIIKLIEHLDLFCGDASDQSGPREVTVTLLRHLFSHRVTPGEFEFLDSIVQGKTSRAEVLLKHLLDSGKNPFLLLSLFARTFANYLALKALIIQSVPAQEIQSRLSMSAWIFQKSSAAVRNYSLSRLKRCVEVILRADSKLKNRSLGPDTTFGELIWKLTP